MGKLVIHEVRQINRLIKKKLPEDFSNMFSSGENIGGEQRMKVIFADTAVEELWEEILWRQHTYKNRVEQGGLLAGYFCNAAEGDEEILPWVEVCHIIPCVKPRESRSDFIRMSAENWGEMYTQLDKLNQETNLNLVPVGWYHTHPNNIPACYSNLDIQTHSQQFTYDYAIGAVFNPHMATWQSYYGPYCQKCQTYLTMNEYLIHKYKIKKNLFHVIKEKKTEPAIPSTEPIQPVESVQPIEQIQKPIQSVECQQPKEVTETLKEGRYDWYGLRKSSWFGVKKFERQKINPIASVSLKQILCMLAKMLEQNVEMMKQLESNQNGILMTAVIQIDNAKNEVTLGKAYFYQKEEELLAITEPLEESKVGILFSKEDFKLFERDSIMCEMMDSLGVNVFVVCQGEESLSINDYHFDVLVKA